MNEALPTLVIRSVVAPTGRRRSNLYAPATYAVAIMGAAVAGVIAIFDPILGLFVAAAICGWAEIDGLWGSSHVGTLNLLLSMDKTRRLRRRACFAYTLGGAATASIVGLTLGLIGAAARGAGLTSQFGFAAMSGIALLLATREIGMYSFALPDFHRQTDKMWALSFGLVAGAAMWGCHIGLGFATVIRHGGFFVVAGCALFLEPLHGAALLASFWLGRTAPIWATTFLTRDEIDGEIVMNLLVEHPEAYRICAFAGLCSLSALSASLALGWH